MSFPVFIAGWPPSFSDVVVVGRNSSFFYSWRLKIKIFSFLTNRQDKGPTAKFTR
jgi:hypothetical protein